MADRALDELIEQLQHWNSVWDGEGFDLDNFDPELLLSATKALKRLRDQVREKDSALAFQLTDHG